VAELPESSVPLPQPFSNKPGSFASIAVLLSLTGIAAFGVPLSAQPLRPAVSLLDNPKPTAHSFRHTIASSQTSQDPIPAPTWELGQPAADKPGTTWEKTSPIPTESSPNWQLAPAGDQVAPQAKPQPEPDEQPSGQARVTAQTSLSPWILGLGGGLRIGIGNDEPTFGMVYGRVGREVGKDAAISLRPAYVFGNVDSSGSSNSQGAFQMPLTLDLYPNSQFSPYAGVGVATNTDSNGNTDAMITAGLDINLVKHLSFSLGINYIIETSDQDNRDVEAFTVLYYRF
jgi:opacity protein-like surface antigen